MPGSLFLASFPGAWERGYSLLNSLGMRPLQKYTEVMPWKKNEVGLEIVLSPDQFGGPVTTIHAEVWDLRLQKFCSSTETISRVDGSQLPAVESWPPRGQSLSYLGSATKQPTTPSKPRLCAAMAAQAMVLTLLGARGHKSRTGPVSGKVRTIIILILVCSQDLFFFGGFYLSSTF